MIAKPQSIYSEYFGFSRDPFGATPDPDYFFASRNHAETLARILYAVEQHEMGLVIGEIGSGKTLLSRCLVDQLDEEAYRFCWIINPQMTASAILKEIYQQLFEKEPPRYKREIRNAIEEGLIQFHQQNILPLIIIDEAQAIPGKEVFEELRLLSNFQTDTENLIAIVFFGQPELQKRLKHRAYRALIERIRFAMILQPLQADEIAGYIRHRFQTAGYSGPELFIPEAIRRISDLTQGYPRRVNHLASFALMEAMGRETREVTVEIVDQAAREVIYLNTK